MNALTSYTLAAFCLLGQVPVETSESLGQGILLTDSGRLFEGKIDHLGNLYRVQSGGRSEMVREANVIFSGQSRDDAYEFLKTKKRTDIAEDAAKLADWCKQYGLAKEAVAEAKIAVKMAPNDRAFAKLLADCEAFSKLNRPVIRVVGTPPSEKTSSTTIASAGIAPPAPTLPTMSATPVARSTAKTPTPIVSSRPEEIEAAFAKSVQPVFMNLCANCHADPQRKLAFRLIRLPEGITVSPSTRENVNASLAQIRKDLPLSSPLVTYAISPHGGKVTSPLNRSTTAFKNLEAWVTLAAATLPDSAVPASNRVATVPAKSVVVVGASTPVTPSVPAEEPKALPPLSIAPPSPSPTHAPAAQTPGQSVPSGTPAVKPVDPFDPVEFNSTPRGTKKP
ncbi:MAG: hypothetical protein U0798_20410 [Gemmataceae bacterium]